MNKERMKRKKVKALTKCVVLTRERISVDERLRHDKRMSEVKIFDEVKRVASLSGWHRKCFAPPRVLVLSFVLS